MHTTDERPDELIELGSVTRDTQGQGGVILEGFSFMKTGISSD